jgi:hypothetical protein
LHDRLKGILLTQKFAPKHWDRVKATVERGVKKKETNSPSCPVLQEVRIVLASACLECSEAHTWKAS